MSGPRSRRLIELNDEDRAELEGLTRRTTAAVGLVRRARTIVLAADGVPLDRIARELGIQRNVVRMWVDRYGEAGLSGLQDRPRSGRPRTFSPSGRPASGAAGL
jgi:predicted ArsR family transcriptional regulator